MRASSIDTYTGGGGGAGQGTALNGLNVGSREAILLASRLQVLTSHHVNTSVILFVAVMPTGFGEVPQLPENDQNLLQARAYKR